jgi:S1-C subfamily serine protease
MSDGPKGNGRASKSTETPKRSGRSLTLSLPAIPRLPVSRPNLSGARLKYLGAAVALILVSLLSGVTGAWLERRDGSDILTTNTIGGKKIVTSQSKLISEIAKTVGPSVVSVNVNIQSSGDSSNDFGFFGFSQPTGELQAAGTGIIISSDGLIVTNRHVVPSGTTKVSVTLSDGTELKDVTVVGRTADNDNLDIAFLKINDRKGHQLTPAAIGDSGTVQVGDDVVAIGNALGQFQNTVTSGIISGYGRSVQAGDGSGSSTSTENLDNLFQTDAAINEGNSGGPLVNLNGQVIGINTAIAGDAQNIGFAIPINDVRGLIKQVIKKGQFKRPYLGVHYIPLTADIANDYGLDLQKGAFIAPSNDPSNPSVVSGGPADRAGLQERDIITSVDGSAIDQSHSLTSLLSPHQPGDKVQLKVLRGDKTLNVSVTLEELPAGDTTNQ